MLLLQYRNVPGKRPFPGKRPCTAFQGVTVAASIQTYGILIPGKRPCRPKLRIMFKRPWVLTRDTTVYIECNVQNRSINIPLTICDYSFNLIGCRPTLFGVWRHGSVTYLTRPCLNLFVSGAWIHRNSSLTTHGSEELNSTAIIIVVECPSVHQTEDQRKQFHLETQDAVSLAKEW
jgi:hypothetical protein